MITTRQQELIAALRTDPGYMLLLDSIQADVDDIQDRMETATGEQNAELLCTWKAMRRLLRTLKTTPEQFTAELDADKEAMHKALDPVTVSPQEALWTMISELE